MSPPPRTHRARVHRALDLARRSDPELRVLAAGAPEDRYLAAAAAFADRDGERTVALLGDASRRVRGVARSAVPVACDDDQVLRALLVAWETRRERSLLRRLTILGRAAPIDRFLDELARREADRELVDSLPFGSEACVRRHLARVLERPSARLYRGLAGSHAGVLGEILLDRWRAVPGEPDPVTRQLTAAHHARIAERDPDTALAIAELLLERCIQPAREVWVALLRLRPERAVPLAVGQSAFVPRGVLAPRARELSPELLALAQAEAPVLLEPHEAWVRTASPERRAAVAGAWARTHASHPRYGAWLLRWAADGSDREAAFTAWSRAARNAEGVVSPGLLEQLPRELAEREGRRHVNEVVALHTRPAARFSGYGRYLPWDELLQAGKDLLGHPDGALRAVALGELLAIPGIREAEPKLVERALEAVLARKFEQDPIRLTMFSALAAWPRRVWRKEHLPAVGQAIRDMLDASDASAATAATAERLVVRLFSTDADWAGKTLGLLVKERGTLVDASLGAKLSDDDLDRAGPALVAITTTWLAQERFAWIATLASSLGLRLTRVAGLAELVLRARDTARLEWEVVQLGRALAMGAPKLHEETLAAHLRVLVGRSFWTTILAHGRDHGVARGELPSERFRRRAELPGELAGALVDVVLRAPIGQEGQALEILASRAPGAFDAALAGLLRGDPSLVRHDVVRSWLTRHRQDLLDPYLSGAPVTGKHATGKTGWVLELGAGTFRWEPAQCATFARTLDGVASDADRDLPTALRAVTRLAELDWHDARELVRLAASDRPAVREKAVRVLARCDAGQGVPTLIECLGDDRARFAVYGLRRALFDMPADRAVSLVLDAPRKKVTVAKEIVRLLGELRTPRGVAELVALSETTLHRDVRIALLRALWDHLGRDETWTIYARAVSDPDWVTASRLADIPADRLTTVTDAKLSVLLAAVVSRPEPEARIDLLGRAPRVAVADRGKVLLEAIRARIASPYDDEVRAAVAAFMARATEDDAAALAATFRDPAMDPRSLTVAVTALAAHDVRTRASWTGFAEAVLRVVEKDRRWGVLAVRCAGAIAKRDVWLTTLGQLSASAMLDGDALEEVRLHLARIPRDEALPLAKDLSASVHPPVRRAAVAVLAHDAATDRGWTEERLALLRTLRQDPHPSVSGAAARVFPPRENDPGW